jgi:signal transduction histidine kinase
MVLCPLTGLDGTLRGVLGLAHRHALRDRDHELVQELCKRLSTALDNDALRGRAVAAQRELRALNLSLEERVQRRTLELEEANRELEAFSYSVSHDLRTPLRHIVGFSDLLGKDAGPNLSAKGQRYLTVITDAAGRMSGLIDSLLEFSRMGRTPLRQAPVALGELVKQAWHNLEPDRLSRQVTLEQGELPTVLGDAALLDLVFQNLLSNAIKYTRTRPEARVTLSAQEEAGWVRVTVADNGVGFDPKYADKLFGVFQRLHRPEEFEGTGIGLANVRRIVTRHGGQVGAEALPGEGAAFWITLPLAPRPQELR